MILVHLRQVVLGTFEQILGMFGDVQYLDLQIVSMRIGESYTASTCVISGVLRYKAIYIFCFA